MPGRIKKAVFGARASIRRRRWRALELHATLSTNGLQEPLDVAGRHQGNELLDSGVVMVPPSRLEKRVDVFCRKTRPNRPSWIAGDDREWRDITTHDTSGCNHRAMPDTDAGQNDDACTDPDVVAHVHVASRSENRRQAVGARPLSRKVTEWIGRDEVCSMIPADEDFDTIRKGAVPPDRESCTVSEAHPRGAVAVVSDVRAATANKSLEVDASQIVRIPPAHDHVF